MGLSNTSLPQNKALKKRYGEVNSPTQGPWNDMVGAILSHRSVRSYTTEKLPDFTLETLIAAAQSAATSSNMQVWSVISTTDPDKKKELAKIAGVRNILSNVHCFLYGWLTCHVMKD